jgi:hypothetical protein
LHRKPDSERFYIVFHATILLLIWLRVKWHGTTPPLPQIRNAPYIPMAEARGFTGRLDKGCLKKKRGIARCL